MDGVTTTRTAAEALEEVLAEAIRIDRINPVWAGTYGAFGHAVTKFLIAHADTLRAALAQPQEVEVELKRVAEHLRQNQVDLPPEFAKVLRENYWDLLIGESPAQSAPAHEPAAWAYYWPDGELHSINPLPWGEEKPRALREVPLYAAPPQDEAREFLAEAILYVRGDAESGYEDAVQLHERIRAYLEKHK